MLKLYQIVMGILAAVLGAMCILQNATVSRRAPRLTAVAKPAVHAEKAVAAKTAPAPAAVAAPAKVQAPTTPAAAIAGEASDDHATDIVSDLMSNPTKLGRIRSFSSLEIDSLYAPLFRSLGLSPMQIEAFKDLVTAREVAQAELRLREQEAETDEDLLRIDDQRTHAMAWFDARLEALLGAGHFEALEGFDKSLAERTMLFDYKQALENVGHGLTYEQEDRLIRMMYDERLASPVINALFSQSDASLEGIGQPDDLLRAFDDWRARVMLRTTGQLTDEQRKALAKQLESQSATLKRYLGIRG